MTFHVVPSLKKFQVSYSQFLNSTPVTAHPAKLVVGVLVFSHSKILLLQRSATERHYPNIWELPSGKVENDDPTLLDAAARECLEETGLTVTAFLAQAKSFEYTIAGRGLTLQMNFDVEVREGDEIKITPDEHQAYRWYDEHEIEEEVGLTDVTKEVLIDAFRRQRDGSGDKAHA